MVTVNISTNKKQEFIDVTEEIQKHITKEEGICSLFIKHTTCGITITENSDPDVKHDILNFLEKIVPENDFYQHAEGNSPAHIKSTLIGLSLTIPIRNKKLQLGTWQSVVLVEFDGPRQREIEIVIQ